MGKKIFITNPSLPDLQKYCKMLEEIWASKWLTNNGKFHEEFERKLASFLNVGQCSLFCNGTLALLVALHSLRLSGEVITTPFTFVATTHSLFWNDIKPVFCDIEQDTFNMNPRKIESLITNRTTAIMPVHVYGTPCDTKAIQEIADMYGLKVIYDAAHAFGVRVNGEPIASFGDLSVLSFHATKVFNTVEGGAIVHNDLNLKKRIDFLKNFGFVNETTIVGTGINAKMNELISAFGLLQLKTFHDEVAGRKKVDARYRENLQKVPGIRLLDIPPGVEVNHSYFPLLVDKHLFGEGRDQLYSHLREHNIMVRRYFYPLVSRIPAYSNLPSAHISNLPVAEKISSQILCLPIYSSLKLTQVDSICALIRRFKKG